MRRVAWFHIVIDTEDEKLAQTFLNILNTALDRAAGVVAEELPGIKVVELTESGQSFPIQEQQLIDRDDV